MIMKSTQFVFEGGKKAQNYNFPVFILVFRAGNYIYAVKSNHLCSKWPLVTKTN